MSLKIIMKLFEYILIPLKLSKGILAVIFEGISMSRDEKIILKMKEIFLEDRVKVEFSGWSFSTKEKYDINLAIQYMAIKNNLNSFFDSPLLGGTVYITTPIANQADLFIKKLGGQNE
jgi:hypothetical protein